MTGKNNIQANCYYDAADPEEVAKCKPSFPSHPGRGLQKGDQSNRVLVPCSPRTTAEEYVKGECGYQYDGEGGLSWCIPYCAGVLALGWQAHPDLIVQEMRELLFKSAYKTPDGELIINPPEFIRPVKARRGGKVSCIRLTNGVASQRQPEQKAACQYCYKGVFFCATCQSK